MNIDEFRKSGHQIVDWMVDYFKSLETLPVRPRIKPGDIFSQIPAQAPQNAEGFEALFADFLKIIVPGMTHWQHPAFFAYFPANNSYPSVLGEMLTAALGAQCMSWETSPAATELEERVMNWIADLIALPAGFVGVIQDTASTATLCSLLTAREKKSAFAVNKNGFYNRKPFTIYCSTEAHSSIEKAVKMAGLGNNNLRKIAVDDNFAMDPQLLNQAICRDKDQNLSPLAVVAAIGTTGSTAIDPLREIGNICRDHDIWLHVDAAYAGTALVLEEKRWMADGLEMADSFVFNPHKWMFTNFDCSAYFVKDKDALLNTFAILPEYLKTREGHRVNNYRDWGIQLGRRFRALKLWFVLRSFGQKGIKSKIRNHIQWAQRVANDIENSSDFELLAPVPLATICFRYKPPELQDTEVLNRLNQQLLEDLNSTGKLFLTHTKLAGCYTIRMVVGQTYVEAHHVTRAWKMIQERARAMGH
jgi:aromatic-L-amino-acid decarboxylase